MTHSHLSAPTARPTALAAGPATTTVGLIVDASIEAAARHAAERLGLGLAVFDPGAVDAGDRGALFAFASACEAVSVDPAVVGVDRLPPAHLDALRDAGHRVWPDPVVVRLSQDRALARSALGAAGFPVAPTERGSVAATGASLSVLVARRPSGWWRARVAVAAGEGPVPRASTLARARALASAVADGLGTTGSLAVDLVLSPSGDLAVAGVTAGPRPPAALGGAALDDHLRALLDQPFAATTRSGPDQPVPAVASLP